MEQFEKIIDECERRMEKEKTQEDVRLTRIIDEDLMGQATNAILERSAETEA